MDSWVVAGAMVVILVGMGVQNRRSGWKAERSDVVLDSLMLWARMVGQSKASQQREALSEKTASAPSRVTSDLAALQTALSTPHPVTISVAVSNTVNSSSQPVAVGK